MKNNVELWMSDLLDILLAFVMDLGSSTNSIVIVMRQKRVRNRGKEKAGGALGKWKTESGMS